MIITMWDRYRTLNPIKCLERRGGWGKLLSYLSWREPSQREEGSPQWHHLIVGVTVSSVSLFVKYSHTLLLDYQDSCPMHKGTFKGRSRGLTETCPRGSLWDGMLVCDPVHRRDVQFLLFKKPLSSPQLTYKVTVGRSPDSYGRTVAECRCEDSFPLTFRQGWLSVRLSETTVWRPDWGQ